METQFIVTLNKQEQNLLISLLNEYRNQMIREGNSIEMINEFLMKTIDAPIKKKSIFNRDKVYER